MSESGQTAAKIKKDIKKETDTLKSLQQRRRWTNGDDLWVTYGILQP